MNPRPLAAFVAVASILAPLAPASAAATTLTGKMTAYSYLVAGPWICRLGPSTYATTYTVAPGNAVHGHLYSAHGGSEDLYLGYRDATRRFWTINADSSGTTESQSSADGVAFAGWLDDGTTRSNVTTVITKVAARRFTLRARGAAGGHPYDVLARCDRT